MMYAWKNLMKNRNEGYEKVRKDATSARDKARNNKNSN